MKKYRIIFVFLLLASFLICNAQQVDEIAARKTGIDFLTGKKVSTDPIQSRIPSDVSYELAYTSVKNGKVCFYVYNCSKGGYVIVSGDNRSVAPVLGYSTVGHFDYSKLGDNVRAWLDSYTNELCALDTLTNVPSHVIRKTPGNSVSPLLGDVAWDQGYPYNIMCPECVGGHYPTGCVITAAAQIMYYHQWPVHGTGIVANGWDNYQTTIDLSESTYRWDIMQPTYDDSSSSEANEAVALLMRDLGYACDAVYCIDGTGADPGECALKLFENFDYSPAITVHSRQYYYDEEWDEILYSELDNNRPCLYSGYGEVGHSFVCDGYDSDGYFHFNFGWSGIGNGYYLGSAIPEYSENQSVVVGIMKNNGEDPVVSLCATDLYFVENNGISSYINMSDLYITALGFDVKNEDYCMGLFIQNLDSEEIIFPFDNSAGSTSIPLSAKRMSASAGFSIRQGFLPDGDYNIYLGVGSKLKNWWQKAHFPDSGYNYISLKIINGEMTFENHIPNNCDEGKVLIDGIYYRLEDNDKTARVTNKSSYSRYYHGDIVIPNSIDVNGIGYSVVGIDESAFLKCDHLKSVFIPNSVEIIDNNAFASSCVESIFFQQDSKLRSIGEGAFYNCGHLENIVLPDGLISIGDGAFNSTKIKSIDIPESVETLGIKVFSLILGYLKDVSVYWKEPKAFDDSFEWGDFKVTLHVPEGTSSLYAELDCWSRFEIVEGNKSEKVKVEDLWYYLLPYNNTAIVCSSDDGEEYSSFEVHIPELVNHEGKSFTVTHLDKECFKRSHIKNIYIPSTVHIIGEGAFLDSEVEQVMFEEKSKLSVIEENAFLNSNLKTIELPENLKSIKQNAFALTELTSIEVPVSVEEIGFNPFSSKANTLTNIAVNWEIPLDFGNIFMDDVKHINLYVPIGTASSYAETESWSGFTINEGKYKERYIIQNGIRYLLKYPAMTATVVAPTDVEEHYVGEDIVIPSYVKFDDDEFIVTEIGPSAFELSEITSIALPNTVESIAFRAFYGSRLKRVDIENNSALKDICLYAFIYCDNLENFPLCENLQRISLGAFGYCSSLKEFYIPKSIITLESYSFDSSLKDVFVYWANPNEFDPAVFGAIVDMKDMVLHTPINTKEKYQKIEPWCYFGNIIEDESLGTVISIESLSISQQTVELKVGEKATLTVTILPEDATDKTVTWSSSDPSVASVTENGEVEAMNIGTTTITATTSNGLSASCEVTVVPVEIKMESIVLDAEVIELEVGDTYQFIATFVPADTTSPELEWWIDDESVAIVDQNGFVTMVGEGSTAVHVHSVRWNDIEAACRIDVSTGVGEILTDDALCDIYTTEGRIIKKSVPISEIQRLDRGLYLIRQNGKTTKLLK